MRYLPIDEITTNMCLGRDLLGKDGKVLLAKGTQLTESYLKRIRDFEVTHLYVYDPALEGDAELAGPISEITSTQAVMIVRDTLEKTPVCNSLDVKQINLVADLILDDILNDRDVVFNIMDLKSHDTYTYYHSVNVCVISVIMGKNLGLPRMRLKELAIGALLHDLGKAYIDPKILEKKTLLTEEEFSQIQEHAKLGFERLRYSTGLSILSAHIAYQHHEREDGSGYPRRLVGDDIHIYAKIAAVADSYDAMTSNRGYKKTVWSHEAIDELLRESPKRYDSKAAAALSWSVARFPIGSVVRLNSNEEAVVVEATGRKASVRIMSGKRMNQTFETSKTSELQIVSRLE